MYQFSFQNNIIQVSDMETNAVVLHQPFNPFKNKAAWTSEEEALEWLASAYQQFLPENNIPQTEQQTETIDVQAQDITPQEE
jgi:hypothetical protein